MWLYINDNKKKRSKKRKRQTLPGCKLWVECFGFWCLLLKTLIWVVPWNIISSALNNRFFFFSYSFCQPPLWTYFLAAWSFSTPSTPVSPACNQKPGKTYVYGKGLGVTQKGAEEQPPRGRSNKQVGQPDPENSGKMPKQTWEFLILPQKHGSLLVLPSSPSPPTVPGITGLHHPDPLGVPQHIKFTHSTADTMRTRALYGPAIYPSCLHEC